MSSFVFPTLPGRAITVERDPEHRVDELMTVSGRRQTFDWGLAPTYRFRLRCNFLRSSTAHRELQTLAGFYAAHRSSAESFLFSDPEDNAVTDHGFGVGDGARTAFQLQRVLDGDVDDLLGTWRRYTKPRTNLWTATGWSGQGALLDQGAAVAPDGTASAVRLTATGTSQARAEKQIALGGVGQVYTWFAFLKRGAGRYAALSRWDSVLDRSAVFDLDLGVVSSTHGSNVTAAISNAGNGWHLCSITITNPQISAASGPYKILVCTPGLPFTPVVGESIFYWAPQLELAAAATRPVAPGVRQDPAYWPAIGDGFEPIFEPDPRDLALWVEGDGLGRRPLARTARTNLAIRSQEFGAWSLSGITVSSDATTAPDGTTTADKAVETATTAVHRFATAITVVVGRTYTVSVYAKAAERRYLGMKPGQSGQPQPVFDLVGGTVVEGASAAVSMEAVGAGWFHCSLTFTANATTLMTYWTILNGTAFAGESYLGDGTSGLFLWGGQVEEASVPGDYIPTAAAQVTRTDATLGANGLVTLAAAPRAGAALSWTGSFWRRVAFAENRLPVERWLAEVYRSGVIELVEVLP